MTNQPPIKPVPVLEMTGDMQREGAVLYPVLKDDYGNTFLLKCSIQQVPDRKIFCDDLKPRHCA